MVKKIILSIFCGVLCVCDTQALCPHNFVRLRMQFNQAQKGMKRPQTNKQKNACKALAIINRLIKMKKIGCQAHCFFGFTFGVSTTIPSLKKCRLTAKTSRLINARLLKIKRNLSAKARPHPSPKTHTPLAAIQKQLRTIAAHLRALRQTSTETIRTLAQLLRVGQRVVLPAPLPEAAAGRLQAEQRIHNLQWRLADVLREKTEAELARYRAEYDLLAARHERLSAAA